MPLGELTDEQMDRLLREMLPRSAGSRAWEVAEREHLLRHISSGAVSSDAHLPVELSGVDVDVSVPVGAHDIRVGIDQPGARTRARRWLVPASVAAAAVLVLGLMAIEREPDEPAPAQQPVVTEGSAPSPVAPALPSDAPLPDRFPIIDDAWPGADRATGWWGGQIGWENGAMTEALVARRDGDWLRDGIALTVRAGGPVASGTPRPTVVAGQLVDVYVENGSPVLTTVVLPGSPVVTVSGRDPIAFLEAVGGVPVVDPRSGPDGALTFDIGVLPDGYETIVAPTPLPLGAIDAATQVANDDADGLVVFVSRRNPLVAWAQATDVGPADVNGAPGWADDRGPGSTVIWRVSETTWASVGAAPDAATALEFARAVRFVDEATWSTRYGVDVPLYSTQAQSASVDTWSTIEGEALPETTTVAGPDPVTTAVEGSALAAALRPKGTVLVVNASGTPGLAGSFGRALSDSGYTVVEPTNSADGVVVTSSAIYFNETAPQVSVSALASIDAVPIASVESLVGQPIRGLTDEMLDRADVIVVLGTDLAAAPWESVPSPLIRLGVGELLVVDASTTPAAAERVARQVDGLRAAGVAIASVVPAAQPVDEDLLMPFGVTPWAFAVAELAGIGGSDTWTPSLIDGQVPSSAWAVLLLTGR